jgi:hypothetical protein
MGRVKLAKCKGGYAFPRLQSGKEERAGDWSESESRSEKETNGSRRVIIEEIMQETGYYSVKLRAVNASRA